MNKKISSNCQKNKITIRCTEKEKEVIDKRASKLGVSKNDYIVSKITNNRKIRNAEMKEVREFTYRMNTLLNRRENGRNNDLINQEIIKEVEKLCHSVK
ncbi:MAG: hypothetical protein R3Y54_08545 [Eubacteriales bacterium]